MNTLTEYQYLSNDLVAIGIAETIVKESPVIARLPLLEVAGNAYKYNRESALASAGFYADGEQWTEGTPSWVQCSDALAILGGDADVSKFAQQTLSNLQDQKAAIIELKAKAIAHEFERSFIYGKTTTTSDTDEFKGLLRFIAECESSTTTDLDSINNDQVIAAAADSGSLSLPLLDELIDCVRPGGPDALMMSRRSRRKVNALARTSSGSPLMWSQDEFGRFIQQYNGIPILINDFILDNFQNGSSSVLDISSYDYSKTRTTNYDNTVIVAVKWGLKAVHGIHNGGIQREDVGTLEQKDASRTRIKWYCAAVLESVPAAAALIDVNPDD